MKTIANNIKNIIGKVYEESDKIDQAISEVKNDEYLSDQGKKMKIDALEEQRAEIISNARREVKTIGENGKTKYSKKYSLNADDITDDMKFLNSGMRLTDKELTAMFDRNDSYTMKLAVSRYADDHEISLDRKVGTIEGANETIDRITKGYFESAMSRPQFRDTWLSDEYVNGISEE